jgi:hypothetical protein
VRPAAQADARAGPAALRLELAIEVLPEGLAGSLRGIA